MARAKGIIVYGEEDDRLRLAALTRHMKARSGSQVMLEMLRERYRLVFGDLAPSLTTSQDVE